ncbi:MAG: TatD family hydrolase [Treponema sp.]|jgi:TatD DNase family protein|nr:TatD family hydrolase [Treponema sp.]
MLTDAHCHPWDLTGFFPGAEEELRRLGVVCAASSGNRRDFSYHEGLVREKGLPLILCFAVHPQLPAAEIRSTVSEGPGFSSQDSLAFLHTLARENRLDAVGETGFDLYNDFHRAAESVQEKLFAVHLETALAKGLPLVLHIRRAMHRVFALTGELKKLPAVIFHSYSGTQGEARSLLKRGINAYFSFGAVIAKNHKEAQRCCAALPAERILLETDAPYQPLRGASFSRWADLPAILSAAAQLREEAGSPCSSPAALEAAVEANFFAAYSPGGFRYQS